MPFLGSLQIQHSPKPPRLSQWPCQATQAAVFLLILLPACREPLILTPLPVTGLRTKYAQTRILSNNFPRTHLCTHIGLTKVQRSPLPNMNTRPVVGPSTRQQPILHLQHPHRKCLWTSTGRNTLLNWRCRNAGKISRMWRLRSMVLQHRQITANTYPNCLMGSREQEPQLPRPWRWNWQSLGRTSSRTNVRKAPL